MTLARRTAAVVAGDGPRPQPPALCARGSAIHRRAVQAPLASADRRRRDGEQLQEAGGRLPRAAPCNARHFNKLNPLLSGLELEADGADDGLLQVHEVLGLRLAADLVTLSACDTALGSGYFAEVPAGDEFVGMTRAFLAAGSASVMATLWEVDDKASVPADAALLRATDWARRAPRQRPGALAEAQRELARGQGPEASVLLGTVHPGRDGNSNGRRKTAMIAREFDMSEFESTMCFRFWHCLPGARCHSR